MRRRRTRNASLISPLLMPIPSRAHSWCTSTSCTTLSASSGGSSCAPDALEMPFARRPSLNPSSVLCTRSRSCGDKAMKWTSLYEGLPATELRKDEGGGAA